MAASKKQHQIITTVIGDEQRTASGPTDVVPMDDATEAALVGWTIISHAASRGPGSILVTLFCERDAPPPDSTPKVQRQFGF